VKHEQLWAPWRLAYISGEPEREKPAPATLLAGADPACFLCQATAGDDDRDRLVVQHGRDSLTVLNRYPYNNGHLLVAPNRHVARLDQLEAAEQLDLVQTISRMIALLEQTIRAEGFNVGLNLGQVAGAGLPGHVHWHIVPRWQGDTNFMPAVAGIRVIPQSLEALWELLTEALGRDPHPQVGSRRVPRSPQNSRPDA
jgi:ATP adenylyltransferase